MIFTYCCNSKISFRMIRYDCKKLPISSNKYTKYQAGNKRHTKPKLITFLPRHQRLIDSLRIIILDVQVAIWMFFYHTDATLIFLMMCLFSLIPDFIKYLLWKWCFYPTFTFCYPAESEKAPHICASRMSSQAVQPGFPSLRMRSLCPGRVLPKGGTWDMGKFHPYVLSVSPVM